MKTLFRPAALYLTVFLLGLTACKEVEPTLPDPPENNNRIVCKLNGKDWETTKVSEISNLDSLEVFGIDGVKGSQNLRLILLDEDLPPGTYDAKNMGQIMAQFVDGTDVYIFNPTGQITIIVNEPAMFAGRFNLELQTPQGGKTARFTQGQFLLERPVLD